MLVHSFIAYKLHHQKKDLYWDFTHKSWVEGGLHVDCLTKDLDLARFNMVKDCKIIRCRVAVSISQKSISKTIFETGVCK